MKKYGGALLVCLIFSFSSCNNELKKESNSQGEPDSLRLMLTWLAEFDSIYKKDFDTEDAAGLDSVIRDGIMSNVEVIPTEKLEEMALMYGRLFGNSELQKSYTNEWLGEVKVRKAEFGPATDYFEAALKGYSAVPDSIAMGRVNNWLGAISSYKGDHLAASNYHYKALTIYEKLKDSSGVISSLREIGGAFVLQQKYPEAISLFSISLKYHERQKDSIGIAVMYSSLGDAYHQIGKYKESQIAMEKALELYKLTGYLTGIAEGYNNLAISNMSSAKFETAKGWLHKALELGDSLGDPRQKPVVMFNLGVCYMETENFEKARSWFLGSINEATVQNQNGEVVLRNYKKLAEMEEFGKNYRESLGYYKKYSATRDSIYSLDNARAIEELKVKYQTYQKEQQLSKTNQEKKSSERRVLLLSSALAFVVLSIIVFIWFVIDRNKRNKQLQKIETELRKKELDHVKQELEFNRTQLSDFTLHLKEKSQQIITLEEQLVKGSRTVVDIGAAKAENQESIYGIKILTDEDWSRFKKYFDKVFPGMIQKLRDLQPDITSAEQRLFMLIRLNTESREIADMLGISPESVRKTKYRLKKKLQLVEDNSLDDFIRNFGVPEQEAINLPN